MKRKNLIIDEDLLERVRKESGIRTYSETVNRALEEYLRLKEAEKIFRFEGLGVLEKRKEDTRDSGKKGKRKS